MKVEIIHNTTSAIEEVKNFLNQLNLEYDPLHDLLVGVYQDNKLIATGAKHNNLFKMVALDKQFQGLGLMSKIITKLKQATIKEGYQSNFLITKQKFQEQFEQFGFNLLVKYDQYVLLEEGEYCFNNYINDCKKIIKTKNNTAIVMNCNPMTLGHYNLIKKASTENDNVIIFIVEEDVSEFKFKDRIEIVKKATSEFNNVIVLNSGQYIISNATFPTYFIREKNSRNEVWANIDALVFSMIAKELDIAKRIVGDEPFSESTNQYNQVLSKVMKENNIRLEIVKRFEINGQAMSASFIRKNINDLEKIKPLLPEATFEFIKKNNQ